MHHQPKQTAFDVAMREDASSGKHPSVGEYFVKLGYQARTAADYYEDSRAATDGLIHQPEVYPFAAYLARRFGCRHIIDVGCGRAAKLTALHPEFRIVGIDFGINLQYCRRHYRFGEWIEHDLEQEEPLELPDDVLASAIVVCSDVIEHMRNPLPLLSNIRMWLDKAPAAIISTPHRDLVRGREDMGPPANPAHVREWNDTELAQLLSHVGFDAQFIGLTVNNDRDWAKKTILAVLERGGRLVNVPAPAGFRVMAIMTTYNECDVVACTIGHLVEQGVEVYVIDNWSEDGTYERAREWLGRGVIAVERFPQEGPSRHYEWRALLARVERLAATQDADWFIHHDADEIRESVWCGVKLRDAIYNVQCRGFNAIDHTVINFLPLNDGFSAKEDLTHYFTHFEFGRRAGHFLQIKAWRRTTEKVDLCGSGGHEACFPGRRVFPYKFLLRHYPIRSQHHGERKVFKERRGRYSPEERRDGWHIQYDQYVPGDRFLADAENLERFDSTFGSRFLVERLSGIGVVRQAVHGLEATISAGRSQMALVERFRRRLARLLGKDRPTE